MDKLNKKLALGGITILFLILSLFLLLYYFSYRRNQESPLYIAISTYDNTKKELTLPQGIVYKEDSGEKFFVEAFNFFLAKEYNKAREYFFYALESEYHDPALPGFSYYFIERCDNLQGQTPNVEIITLALEEIAKYAPLSNNISLLLNLFNSYSSLYDTDDNVIALWEKYLNDANTIELSTWAWVKNNIATLEYNNEEYSKSIRHFYDIESTLTNVKQTPEIRTQLVCAKEYIANIHFSFRDYKKAALLYEDIIYDSPPSESYDTLLNCTNLASCYLELSDTKKARETIDFLEAKIPQLPEYLQGEVQASIHDILANIALKERNYSQADFHLKLSEEYFKEFESTTILGGEYFTQVTRCKYLVEMEKYVQALPLLLEILADENALYYGFEEDIYSLLKVVYYHTGEHQKLYEVYEKLLKLNEDFEHTVQREYLEFSSYYKENNRLKAYNAILSRRSSVAVVITLIVCFLLVIFVIFLKILTRKNITDQLTGAYNRKKLNRLIRQYNRFGTPSDFAIIMMDIDYFKKYNDTYGHPEGDKILKKVSKILLSSVRKKDILIRYGGEEFLLLINSVSADIAKSICERIKNQINNAALPHNASEISDHITLSIGLCHQTKTNTLHFEALVEEADQCLYQAKENGRNQLSVNYF